MIKEELVDIYDEDELCARYIEKIETQKNYLTVLKNLCIIDIGNDKSTNVVLPKQI